MLDINIDKLNRIIDDFYKITGVMIGAYDVDFKMLSSRYIPHCSFCKAVRKYDKLNKKCHECDIEGIKKCTGSRSTQTYLCHMGLVEAITPIYSDNILVGYILIGQMLDRGNIESIKKNIENMDDSIDKKELYCAIDDVSVFSKDKIESVVSLMDICTKYLMLEKVVNVKLSLLSSRINDYINNNLDKDIGISDICKKLNISRSKLYEVSTEFFKMGITDYIRHLRIEQAKKLLKSGECTINETAKLVGLPDANYFTKIFKKYTGVTPSAFKNTNL